MRSSTLFFGYVLGLLPSLSIAASLPTFSTLDKPFTLRADRPAQENVTLEFQDLLTRGGLTYFAAVTRLSLNSSEIAQEFKLTNGDLTTADGSTTAFLASGGVSQSEAPLFFGDFEARAIGSLDPFSPVFVAQTVSTASQGSKLQLLSTTGGKSRH